MSFQLDPFLPFAKCKKLASLQTQNNSQMMEIPILKLMYCKFCLSKPPMAKYVHDSGWGNYCKKEFLNLTHLTLILVHHLD